MITNKLYNLRPLGSDVLSVIFPKLCAACGERSYRNEKQICLSCLANLPLTHFHKDLDNPVNKIFWGRVNIEFASAFLFFSVKGIVQHMIHQLKYKGNKDIGIFLGSLYGDVLKNEALFSTVDCIVPVPLHPGKLKKRGYNQSEMIAIGLSQSMNKPVDTTSFGRSVYTESQTKKGRYKRWENVDNIFKLTAEGVFEGKHVLLVDDVITTGATIEACAQEILKEKRARVTVVALACAMHL
jgi:ComF family protein